MDPSRPGPPPHRAAVAQVFVADLSTPELDDETFHHLSRVLRLRAGQTVCAADGLGRWRPTVFTGGTVLDPSGEPVVVDRAEPRLTVGFVPVKGDRPELVVQKLTEIGVDHVVVCASDRSVVRWEGERAVRHMDRLRRVAREAAQQCRRLWLPTVEHGDLDDLASDGTVMADMGGRDLTAGDRGVVVGPEGGWTDAERQRFQAVSLGEHVLRAETAAIAAGVLMTALRRGNTSAVR